MFKTQSIKINYFEIAPVDFDILYDIYQNIMPAINDENKFSEFIYVNTYSNNKIKPQYITDILIISEKYFSKYGYKNNKIQNDNYFIELSRYKCIKNANSLSILGYHKDDYATTDYKVNTIIFYLSKSDTIEGGDLSVNINKKETCIPIKEKKAICFKGDLLHMPTKILGEGIRECIVVQIQKK